MKDRTPHAPGEAALAVGIHAQSARAFLLVVMGEFVWPRGGSVWSATLLDVLAELGVEATAGRKAIQRTADLGVIEARKQGRCVEWSISPHGRCLFAAEHERVHGWSARDTAWDGRWLVVSVSVPQSQRRTRHHLQARLSWAGLGSPVPGQWLTSHSERATDVEFVIEELGLRGQAHSFVGVLGPVGDEQSLVNASWDLDLLAEQYRNFIAACSARDPKTDRECMIELVQLVQSWRGFPYGDPDVPKRFLPAAWPGSDAAQVFHECYNAWAPRANSFWDQIEVGTSSLDTRRQ